LKNADIKIIRKLLTLHIRKERFYEGHLIDIIDSGHMVIILNRLVQIRENMFSIKLLERNIMRWTREVSRKIAKLYLTNERMTESLKQAILEIAPNYPQKYFEPWFKLAYNYTKGLTDTGSGPGTDYILGFLDTVKELNLDITLCIQATKGWRKNNKREQAINDWLTKNT